MKGLGPADSFWLPRDTKAWGTGTFIHPLETRGGGGGENKEAETSDGYEREVGEEAGFSFSFLLSFSLLPSPLFSFPLHPSTIFGRNQRSKESIHPPQFLGMRRSIQGLSLISFHSSFSSLTPQIFPSLLLVFMLGFLEAERA